jgi:hypothetical protein
MHTLLFLAACVCVWLKLPTIMFLVWAISIPCIIVRLKTSTWATTALGEAEFTFGSLCLMVGRTVMTIFLFPYMMTMAGPIDHGEGQEKPRTTLEAPADHVTHQDTVPPDLQK